MLRGLSLPKERLMELSSLFAASITSTFLVTENSPVIGKTLVELDLRKKTGTTIIAIVRGSRAVTSLSADLAINAGDMLVLLGSHAQLDQAVKLLTR